MHILYVRIMISSFNTKQTKQFIFSWRLKKWFQITGSCLDLKRCPSVRFSTHFFTSINPIWVGDLRIGEFLIFFEDYGRYSPFCVFAHAEPALKICLRRLNLHKKIAYAGWACAKKLPTQAEPALKNCLHRLSLR